MYIYVHAAFLLNFILKNISPKKLIKDGNWYHSGARKVALFLAQKYLDVEMLVYVNSYDRGNLEENELSFVRVDFEDSAEIMPKKN